MAQQDLGSKGSVPALELIPAVEENEGEGKERRNIWRLVCGSSALTSREQGEENWWITDRSVKGNSWMPRKIQGEKKVDLFKK